MSALKKEEMSQYQATLELLGSADTRGKGIEQLFRLAIFGQTKVSDWAKTHLKNEFQVEIARNLLDATPSKTDRVS